MHFHERLFLGSFLADHHIAHSSIKTFQHGAEGNFVPWSYFTRILHLHSDGVWSLPIHRIEQYTPLNVLGRRGRHTKKFYSVLIFEPGAFHFSASGLLLAFYLHLKFGDPTWLLCGQASTFCNLCRSFSFLFSVPRRMYHSFLI